MPSSNQAEDPAWMKEYEDALFSRSTRTRSKKGDGVELNEEFLMATKVAMSADRKRKTPGDLAMPKSAKKQRQNGIDDVSSQDGDADVGVTPHRNGVATSQTPVSAKLVDDGKSRKESSKVDGAIDKVDTAKSIVKSEDPSNDDKLSPADSVKEESESAASNIRKKPTTPSRPGNNNRIVEDAGERGEQNAEADDGNPDTKTGNGKKLGSKKTVNRTGVRTKELREISASAPSPSSASVATTDANADEDGEEDSDDGGANRRKSLRSRTKDVSSPVVQPIKPKSQPDSEDNNKAAADDDVSGKSDRRRGSKKKSEKEKAAEASGDANSQKSSDAQQKNASLSKRAQKKLAKKLAKKRSAEGAGNGANETAGTLTSGGARANNNGKSTPSGKAEDVGGVSDMEEDETQDGLWVECDRCKKWRKLPPIVNDKTLPKKWFCEMNTHDPARNHCNAPEEKWDAGPAEATVEESNADKEASTPTGPPKVLPKAPGKEKPKRGRKPASDAVSEEFAKAGVSKSASVADKILSEIEAINSPAGKASTSADSPLLGDGAKQKRGKKGNICLADACMDALLFGPLGLNTVEQAVGPLPGKTKMSKLLQKLHKAGFLVRDKHGGSQDNETFSIPADDLPDKLWTEPGSRRSSKQPAVEPSATKIASVQPLQAPVGTAPNSGTVNATPVSAGSANSLADRQTGISPAAPTSGGSRQIPASPSLYDVNAYTSPALGPSKSQPSPLMGPKGRIFDTAVPPTLSLASNVGNPSSDAAAHALAQFEAKAQEARGSILFKGDSAAKDSNASRVFKVPNSILKSSNVASSSSSGVAKQSDSESATDVQHDAHGSASVMETDLEQSSDQQSESLKNKNDDTTEEAKIAPITSESEVDGSITDQGNNCKDNGSSQGVDGSETSSSHNSSDSSSQKDIERQEPSKNSGAMEQDVAETVDETEIARQSNEEPPSAADREAGNDGSNDCDDAADSKSKASQSEDAVPSNVSGGEGSSAPTTVSNASSSSDGGDHRELGISTNSKAENPASSPDGVLNSKTTDQSEPEQATPTEGSVEELEANMPSASDGDSAAPAPGKEQSTTSEQTSDTCTPMETD